MLVPPAEVPTLLFTLRSSLCEIAPFPAFTAVSTAEAFKGFPFSSLAFLNLTPADPTPDILIVP